jgi:hypothetical protein
VLLSRTWARTTARGRTAGSTMPRHQEIRSADEHQLSCDISILEITGAAVAVVAINAAFCMALNASAWPVLPNMASPTCSWPAGVVPPPVLSGAFCHTAGMVCMSRAEEDDTNGQAQQVCELRVVQVLKQGTNDWVIMLH